jgi:hypothetical protein
MDSSRQKVNFKSERFSYASLRFFFQYCNLNACLKFVLKK